MIETKVSEIQPGDQWLLEGAWVTVREVLSGHPGDRVTVSYEQDGEVFDLSEYRTDEVAVVKRDGATAGYRELDRDSLGEALRAGIQAMVRADGHAFMDPLQPTPGYEKYDYPVDDFWIETSGGIDLRELADHVLAALDGAQ